MQAVDSSEESKYYQLSLFNEVEKEADEHITDPTVEEINVM